MPEILTESFCERCGTRYTFESSSATRTKPLRGLKTFGRGLRNFVLSDDSSMDEAMAAVIEQLSRGPYLLGEEFSAADILYGTTFAMFLQSPLLPKSTVVEQYVQRVVGRPAFARARALDG